MINNETELKDSAREMTGYTSTKVLTDSGLDTAYQNAKRHARIQQGVSADFDWYNPEFPERQDALYWWTCLFAKVQTGELGSQTLQAGAVDEKTLLAKEGDEITMWYRRADSSLRSLSGSSIIQSSSPARGNREYTPGTYTSENGGTATGGSSEFDV